MGLVYVGMCRDITSTYPNNRESNAKEHGKWNGNWVQVSDFRLGVRVFQGFGSAVFHGLTSTRYGYTSRPPF